MTLRMSSKRTFGAASRSSPSLRWNSSRYSSGTRPTSRNDITWPSFIAAPFIVPSAATICSAASRWRRSSAACLPSSERRDVRRQRAELARRLAGRQRADLRRARQARGRDAVLGHRPDIGRARAAARPAQGVGVALGAGVAVAPGATPCGAGVGVGVAVGVAVGVVVGRRRRRRLLRRRGLGRRRRGLLLVGGARAVAAAEERRAPVAVGDRVAEDRQLRRRHDGRRGEERDQAGDDRRSSTGAR